MDRGLHKSQPDGVEVDIGRPAPGCHETVKNLCKEYHQPAPLHPPPCSQPHWLKLLGNVAGHQEEHYGQDQVNRLRLRHISAYRKLDWGADVANFMICSVTAAAPALPVSGRPCLV